MPTGPQLLKPIVEARQHPLIDGIWRLVRDSFRRVAPHLPTTFVRLLILMKARLSGLSAARPGPASSLFDLVFDEAFYLEQVGVLPPSFGAAEHYRTLGWRRNLDPSPLFDVAWYREQYAATIGDDVEPLDDYLIDGWSAGRDPAPWFSTSWYLAELARQGAEPENPLVHYVRLGCAVGATVSERHAALLDRTERLDVATETVVEATWFGPDGATEAVTLPSLESTGHRLVSFDLWDTLIRRTRPPDAAKVATARRMARQLDLPPGGTWELYEERVALEREFAEAEEHEEYRAREVLCEMLTRRGVDGAAAGPIGDELADHELQDEIANTQLVGPTASLFRRLSADGRSLVILSDFYMGGAELGRLARAKDLDIDPDDVRVSCDIGASKRLGTAYPWLHARYGVEPSDHLHIGDNRLADIDRAVEHGATAVMVAPASTSWPTAGALSPDWYTDVPNLIRDEMESLLAATTHAHRDSIAIRHAKQASGALSVLVVAHVAAAIDAALRRGVPVVHYMSREGAFLASVHRRVADILADGAPPRAVHLEVSRRSTFGPSLERLDADSLALIARQYPVQSVRGLLTSLGVDSDSLGGELACLPFDPDEPLHLATSGALMEFLERPPVRSAVERRWSEQRSLLRRYLAAREFGPESVVVDVGWRGTIQDNLCRMLPASTVHGVYLGLFPYHNPQLPNATKEAVVFDGNLGDEYAHVDPPAVIESPLTPPIPTVIRYDAVSERVEPVRVNEPGRADTLIGALQTSLLDIAPRVAERLVAFGATTDLLRAGSSSLVAALYQDPPRGLADIWFESVHDDTFGAANVTPYGKRRVDASLLAGTTPSEAFPGAVESGWVAGYRRWTPVEALDLLRTLRAGGE